MKNSDLVKMNLKRVLLALAIFAILSELILRYGFGFCDTVLFKADPDFEYISQPNQDRHRFGSHIAYNEASMRSEAIDTNALHILALGDSVLNGGTLTDQGSLATTLLSKQLTKEMKKQVQVLNVSAGSWGPDNAFAYLKKYGDFNSKLLITVFSSHDYNDNMTHEDIVGIHPSYPKKQYILAWMELVDRYLIPRVKRLFPANETDEETRDKALMINKNGKTMNTGFKDIALYAQSENIPLLVFFHPEVKELKENKYSDSGKKVISFYEKLGVPVVKLLETGYKTSYYRDEIHLNEKGQYHLFDVMNKEVEKILLNE